MTSRPADNALDPSRQWVSGNSTLWYRRTAITHLASMPWSSQSSGCQTVNRERCQIHDSLPDTQRRHNPLQPELSETLSPSERPSSSAMQARETGMQDLRTIVAEYVSDLAGSRAAWRKTERLVQCSDARKFLQFLPFFSSRLAARLPPISRSPTAGEQWSC